MVPVTASPANVAVNAAGGCVVVWFAPQRVALPAVSSRAVGPDTLPDRFLARALYVPVTRALTVSVHVHAPPAVLNVHRDVSRPCSAPPCRGNATTMSAAPV